MSRGLRPGILSGMEPSTTESVPLRTGPLNRPIPCPVRWQRSSRARRVSLRIDPCAAEVIVTLPPRASRQQGMALLTAHAAWVMERLSSLAPPQPFQDGAEIPLGGVPHPIRHEPQARG
ncbi:zinc metallopeptidase, partial [Roseomonas sp. DSM 102946]|nr:zinc metallopeptidase [Roseomonas sp. DSM 102946]